MVLCGGRCDEAISQFGRRDTTEYVTHEELGTLSEPIRQDIHNLSLEVGVLKEDVHQLRKGNVDIKNQLAGLVLGQSHAVRLIAMLMTPEQRDTARELGIPI